MKDLRWPHAVLMSTVLLVLGGLAYTGKDSAAVIGGVLAVLGAMGFLVKQQAEVKEQATAIKEQTNGNTAVLVEVIREQQRQIVNLAHMLADMHPTKSTDPPDSD